MKSIYHHLIVPVITVILLLTAAVACFTLYGIRGTIAPQMERLETDTLQARADQVSIWMESKVTEVEHLAEMFREYTFEGSEGEESLIRLREFLESNTHSFESMGYVTLDGEKHVTDGSVFSIKDRPYFRKIQEAGSRTVISDSVESKANGKKIILIITQVVDKDGILKGYLSGAITLEYLQTVVREAGLSGYPMFIVNGSDYALIAGEYSEERPMPGERLLHSRISGSPTWHIALRSSDAALKKTTQQYIQVLLLFLAAACGAGIWMVVRIARHVVSPIQVIQGEMEKTKHGMLEKAQLGTRISEVQSLADSYNYMIDNINRLLAQLKKEEAQKIEAESKARYSQIQPHFLYNTLETIQAIAFDHDDQEVEEAIGNLASLFRIGLSSGKQMIPLKDELQHVKSYLEIQTLRYGHLFDYRIENTADTQRMVLKFLLQPLVENAIYHGIKNSSKKGIILILVREEAEEILVEVKNTYENLELERMEEVNSRMARGAAP